jgi:hypothetical protein
MKRHLTHRALVITLAALAALAAAACQKASPNPAADSTQAAAGPQTTPQAVPRGDAPAAALPKVQVCQLLTAAEVGAVMGKTMIQDGCGYGLDPARKEKAMAESQDQMARAQKRAAAGDMSGFMKGMMNGQQKMGAQMADQLTVNVDASRDDQTEDAVKAIYAKTGATVRGAVAPLQPEQRGLNGLIQGLDEVSGVGDWAFATNVASTSLGPGFSIRGRILEARKGPWRVTVSTTVAPDPGAAALDGKMAGVARALIAKLPAH